jgi:hypothetical protein
MIAGQYSTSIDIQANALAGTFDVVLRRTFCDQFVQETIPVVITPYLIPAFDKIPGICQFDTEELVPSNTENIIGTWTWTIGGVSFPFHGLAADAAFDYTFNTAGDIPISLSFIADGCTQEYEIVQVFQVNPAPNISCSYTEVSTTIVELNATIQDPILGIYTYLWSNSATTPITQVPNTGSFTYTCTVTNTTTGCTASEDVEDETLPSCIVEEGYVTFTLDCNTGVFTRFGNSGTVQLNWIFYQNSMQPSSIALSGTNNEVCTAEFVNAGFYMVRAGEEIAGCGHIAEIEIEVPLIPAILVNYNCAGTNQVQLELTNNSDYMTDVVINTVAWTVDGLPETSPVTVNSGTHIIGLEITYTHDMQQFTCSTSTTVTYLRGDASFVTSPGPYCSGSPIQFTDNSINAVSWVYDFNAQYQNLNQNNEQSFENSGSGSIPVFISLSIQDNIGCLDNFVNSITVNPNFLEGLLSAENGPYCSGENWPYTFSFQSGVIPTNVDYLWLPTNEPSIINTHDFLQTGSYYVTLSDNNNCIYQSEYVNICFDNTPYALISGNDVYCPDEVIRLFGEAGDYTYLWEGLGSSVYSTPNISLPAAGLAPGVYSVTLTVSNANCSSSDVQDIIVHQAPPAPTIIFGANQCLHIPPVNLQSAISQYLYWSTGNYGISTTTFNAGWHLAHYLDPITGCKSEYDTIYVVKPPDFNELMTGCFSFCPEDLPKTVLPPMGFFDYWAWMRNMIIVQEDWHDIPYSTTLLEINDFGTYNMNVEYAGACHTMSDDLEIMEEEVCDSCEIRIKTRWPKCAIKIATWFSTLLIISSIWLPVLRLY